MRNQFGHLTSAGVSTFSKLDNSGQSQAWLDTGFGLQSAMEEQQKRTGLLKQMTTKLGIDPNTCAGQELWPCGDPPSTLETLLLSDDWYPVFLTFLQDTELEVGQENSEQMKKLLRAARIVCSDGVSQEKGKGCFKEILADCQEDSQVVLHNFLKYVEKRVSII